MPVVQRGGQIQTIFGSIQSDPFHFFSDCLLLSSVDLCLRTFIPLYTKILLSLAIQNYNSLYEVSTNLLIIEMIASAFFFNISSDKITLAAFAVPIIWVRVQSKGSFRSHKRPSHYQMSQVEISCALSSELQTRGVLQMYSLHCIELQ